MTPLQLPHRNTDKHDVILHYKCYHTTNSPFWQDSDFAERIRIHPFRFMMDYRRERMLQLRSRTK